MIPHSLRDVSISNPKMGNAIIDEGWIVCLKANGKNLYGAYTGLKETAYVIKFGKVTFVTKKAGFVVCSELNAQYESWPEMDSMVNKTTQ